MNPYIDAPVFKIINYFNSQMNAYIAVALMLGKIFCCLGILWNCFQMVFGTLEQRKFIVGTVTKWFLFLLILYIYPATSRGLMRFSIQMADYVSGVSINSIAEDFGKYLDNLEAALKAEEDQIDELIKKLKAEKETEHTYYQHSGYNPDDKFLIPIIEENIASNEKKKAEIGVNAEKPKGKAKTINAIRSILTVDDNSITNKYRIDLSMKNNGVDTGLLSPSSMLRMTLLSAQIMWQKTWENDVMTAWNEKAEKGLIKAKLPSDFPFTKIFDIILCFLCEIIMVAITCIECIQYTMCIIEFMICVTFGVVLIPCLLFDGLKDMAMKLMPTLLSQAVKLAMITICMYFCCITFLDLARSTIADTAPFGFTTAGYVIFTVLLTFTLCSNAPKLASAMLTGQPQMSMGEFVQAAGAIAAGFAMAPKGVELGRQAVGAGARAGVNALGNAAAMVGGAQAGAEKAAAKGKGKLGQAIGAIKGATKAGSSRSLNKLKSGLQNAANYRGKGAGGGMGGAGGSGTNRFGSNDQKIAAHGRKTDDLEKPYEAAQRNTMDYASHKTETGAKSTLGEYLKAQKAAGYASVGGSKPQNKDLAVGNQKKENASMSKEVAVPNSPIYNFGSSTSYTPPMRNVTPEPEALPPSGLPAPSKRKFISGDIDGAMDV